MEKPKWSRGAKIWLTLMVLGQWLTFINEATKRSVDEQAMLAAGIVGALGTALYLWLAFSKTKAALYTIIVIGVANAVYAFINGITVGAVLGLIVTAITYSITSKTVS